MRGNRTSMRALVAGCLLVACLAVAAGGAGAATDPTTPGVPLANGMACLPGTWSLILPNSPPGLAGNTTTSDGTVTLQIGPGRKFVETYASTTSSGQPGPGGTYLETTTATTGTVRGDWTATVRNLTLRHIRNDTSAVSTVRIDQRSSEPATESPAPQTFRPKRQTTAYTCSGDTLKLASVGGIKQGFVRVG